MNESDPIMRYFGNPNLPQRLRAVSKRFEDLANWVVSNLPRSAERTVALRKLLEGKDAAVRACLDVDELPDGGPKRVRAKFTVAECREEPGDNGYSLTLSAVIGNTVENEEFFKHTPYGEINMGVVAKDTAALFEPGTEFYVDFTPA
jgi:hypothetical protein